ncbi:hypothetical protein [Sphingomonas jatrophae]|uniref:Uncharacterized protein n=1 Tax=Sphingomonas jatrophae TaxID=1166337 RepID=A0A1I6K7A1_9SPHN|nr:hypothetical protein [Sphingomonas jatrophae]SFR87066.1 hypothetical protein SAMN05192580_1402 [Sphingomonas jatrophae]
MHRLATLPLLIMSAAAGAQSLGTTGGTSMGAAASLPGTAGGAGGSLSGGTMLGRPPSPLGTTSTLGQRIDRAAGLGTSRASGGVSLPSTLRPETRVSGGAGGVLASDSALNDAGRPAGAPLGTTPTGPASATTPRPN